MLPWNRPDPHPEFEPDAAVLLAELRADVAKNKGVPHGDHFKNREIWTSSWARRKQQRGLHKTALGGAESWLSKCVWCEQQRPPKGELDVEHYRPKVDVSEWTGTPPIVSDTPPPKVTIGSGYWWLAFDWKNYSLACGTCNQIWKRSLFPVAAPRTVCVEGVEKAEKPLLLDPGSTFRTRDHFRWAIDGIVQPLSPEGYATIVTCGLNRKDLRIRRGKVAYEISRTLDELMISLRTGKIAERDKAYREIARLGSRAEEFTSMVRWFVEERLACSWDELDGLPA